MTSSPPPRRTSKAGEFLDGEGGYTVWGKLVSAETSVAQATAARRTGPPRRTQERRSQGQSVSWDDVIIDESLSTALELRRETEALIRTTV